AFRVQHVISSSSTYIDHQRTEVFFMLGEHDLRRSQAAKNHVFHVQRQFFHTSNSVLNPCTYAVDDVKICFQFLPEHPDRIQHALLSVDLVMLNDRMEERVLRRDAHLARVNFYVLHILLINFVAVLWQHDASAIVKTLRMRSGDSDVNALDHDVAFLFGIDNCFVQAFHCGFKIDNLALAHAARWGLTYPEDFEG